MPEKEFYMNTYIYLNNIDLSTIDDRRKHNIILYHFLFKKLREPKPDHEQELILAEADEQIGYFYICNNRFDYPNTIIVQKTGLENLFYDQSSSLTSVLRTLSTDLQHKLIMRLLKKLPEIILTNRMVWVEHSNRWIYCDDNADNLNWVLKVLNDPKDRKLVLDQIIPYLDKLQPNYSHVFGQLLSVLSIQHCKSIISKSVVDSYSTPFVVDSFGSVLVIIDYILNAKEITGLQQEDDKCLIILRELMKNIQSYRSNIPNFYNVLEEILTKLPSNRSKQVISDIAIKLSISSFSEPITDEHLYAVLSTCLSSDEINLIQSLASSPERSNVIKPILSIYQPMFSSAPITGCMNKSGYITNRLTT